MSSPEYRKSSYSCASGCVEVAFDVGTVYVRDSKNRSGNVLEVASREWSNFVRAVSNGEFGLILSRIEDLDSVTK
jgi:hypothetical protein